MTQQLYILEDLLKKYSENPDEINLKENEVDHYSYFEKLTDQNDKDLAWSQFEESKAIRYRLHELNHYSKTIEGWGYKIGNQTDISDIELTKLVENHIKSMSKLVLDEDYNRSIIDFIESGFEVRIAESGSKGPEINDNELFGTLYEGITETLIEHFPFEIEHYNVLYNWAIYLTKCDEIAFYLLWPCFSDKLPKTSAKHCNDSALFQFHLKKEESCVPICFFNHINWSLMLLL